MVRRIIEEKRLQRLLVLVGGYSRTKQTNKNTKTIQIINLKSFDRRLLKAGKLAFRYVPST
jgi:hypothetical protein